MLPAVAIALILPSCKGKQEQQQQQQAPELAVLTVSEENTTLESGMPTTLEGENDVEIRPQISGFLTKVCVEEGQKVGKGQTLFIIDQVSLQAAVDAAQAAVAVAQANVNTATTNMNNNKMLFEKNIISQPLTRHRLTRTMPPRPSTTRLPQTLQARARISPTLS